MTKKVNKRRLVIWALFDDANCSYKKAIKQFFDGKFKVFCFGINNRPKAFSEESLKSDYQYNIEDLSLLNFKLINDLKKYPQPDIILASPPCESWSGADCAGRIIKEINSNCIWKIANEKYYNKYNLSCSPVKRRFFMQKETSRILGEATVGATIQIIRYFKPKIWIIENPMTSRIWMYIKNHWNDVLNDDNSHTYINKVFYSAYNPLFSAKPTILKSNIQFNLLSNRNKSNADHMAKGNYEKRSAIPANLIKDIIKQILEKVNNEN